MSGNISFALLLTLLAGLSTEISSKIAYLDCQYKTRCNEQ